MGNKSSYFKLLSEKNKVCITHTDIVYMTINGCASYVMKYYLPDRNIGFHIYDDLFYVYSYVEDDYIMLQNYKEILMPTKLYNKIIELYQITNSKKIKALYIIDELKKLN